MKKIAFPVSGCYSCPKHSAHYIQNMRVCNGGKRPRRFRSRDPKIKAPVWCPRRNAPAIIRVYRLKDEFSRAMHFHFEDTQIVANDKIQYAHPLGHRYIRVYEGRRQITASRFYECAKNREALELLEFELEYGDVVEIDDGLTPYFFYLKTYQTFQPAYFTPPTDEALKTKSKAGKNKEQAK